MVFLVLSQLALVLGHVSLSLAAPAAVDPTVKLDNGTFVGAASGGIDKFLGIPFAKPPVGDLRFRLPVASDPYSGTHEASSFGLACPQQALSLPLPSGIISDALDFVVNGLFGLIQPAGEDCLTINVWRPSGLAAGTKLPVATWIFGGGFELGGTPMYDGGAIVSKSIQLGTPVVYVSMNYRVSAFGFLAGKEVKSAGIGNLGLQDQRLALRWIQKYVSAFGGDPTKVTIWGESAGAISVALQMVTNGGNTEGLFRGAFMQSGSPIPVGDITNGQPFYDALVSQTGCQGSSDTLQCLRQAPFATLKKAVDNSPSIFSPQSLALAWLPRADGVFLPDTPQKLVQQGSVANVPFVTGDCDDEGTLFSLALLNITTESDVRSYVKSNYINDISDSDLDKLLKLYPQDLTQGSPFNTGILNGLSSQFKRLAALQGDLVFQAPRRFFLEQRSGKQNTWSFLNKRLKVIPAVGSAHGTDILNIYGGGDLSDYLINFVNNLDPNGKTVTSWPKYTTANPQMLTLLDGLIPRTLSQDTFRKDGTALLTQLSLAHPI